MSSQVNERVRRANAFYFASRNPRVSALLKQVGFNEEARLEGAELLRNAVTLLRQRQAKQQVDAGLIERCESYQRRWFPTVRATLERHYPELAEPFFEGLVQLTGKEAPLSVMEFLGTLDRLESGAGPFAEKGPEARDLIASRMLTAEVEAEGQALVDEWEKSAATVIEVDSKKDEAEAAVDALWKWRMEWTRLARTVIAQRNTLRQLGMGRRKSAAETEEDDADDETLALAPAITPPALPPVAVATPGATPSPAALPASALPVHPNSPAPIPSPANKQFIVSA